LLKANRVEEDLGNHGVVGDHHGARAEEDFEVVREVRPACVAWVHGDVDAASGDQRNDITFEVEDCLLVFDGSLNGEYLLGDDGEYFCVNAVEFVKAAPRA
jgi:hypothetical protein